MKAGRTEDLIVALAADARPVSRLAPPRVRALAWLGASTAITAAGVVSIGAREDLPSAIGQGAFIGDALLAASTGVLGAAGAFALSVPAAERTSYRRWLPLTAGVAWTTFLASRFIQQGGTWSALAAEPWHPACPLRLLLFAALPAVAAFVMIRRAAPLEPRWTAALASLGALGLAAVGLQFVCPIGTASHLLVAHAVPVAALTAVGVLLGARRLNRWLLDPLERERA